MAAWRVRMHAGRRPASLDVVADLPALRGQEGASRVVSPACQPWTRTWRRAGRLSMWTVLQSFCSAAGAHAIATAAKQSCDAGTAGPLVRRLPTRS